MLQVHNFVCGPLQNNVHLVVDPQCAACAVVDPGIDCSAVSDTIAQQGLNVRYILLTHGHFDHAYSAAEYVARYHAPLAIHAADLQLLDQLATVSEQWGLPPAEPAPTPDLLLIHGQKLELGSGLIEVRHTPGHSPGQVALVADGHVLVGDTLFWRGIGRYDLPGSDYDSLVRSIREQLYTLPGETQVWPGHGRQTTIDQEQRLNPYVGAAARFRPLS